MTAEAIARVVADLKAGRARNALIHTHGPSANHEALFQVALDAIVDPVVIDASAIFDSVLARDAGTALYEDHPNIAPPWEDFAVCYVNTFGNVFVIHCQVSAPEEGLQPWEPAEPVEWDRVPWLIEAFIWMGGRSHTTGEAVATIGPVHLWRIAVYDDGEPADIHWVRVLETIDGAHSHDAKLGDRPGFAGEDAALLVLLGALNFLGCRNIELVEPQRPRGVRRRLERTGVRVQTLNVFPTGKSTRGGPAAGGGVPLTSVRGHFATYGEKYGRGKLFGKLEGRFWIPQHARGERELGETANTYRLRADG